jgi:cell division protein FtsI/penicillin-binding protein 2
MTQYNQSLTVKQMDAWITPASSESVMKRIQLTIILTLLLAILGCTPGTVEVQIDGTPTMTATLPDPQVFVTPAPDLEAVIEDFMDAWRQDDYVTMYGLISAESRRANAEEDFRSRYNDAAIAMTLLFNDGITYQVLSREINPQNAFARLQVNYNTNFFGTFTRELEMTLVREGGAWRIAWDEGLVMPDLIGGNALEIVRQSVPRGNIYANDGSPIAAQEDAVAIGFIPANLDQDRMTLFYNTMARLTIYQIDEIIEIVERALPNDYIPLGGATSAQVSANMGSLSALSGVLLNYYTSRFYFDGGLAPQAVGHLTYISSEEMDRYLRLGYSPNERFGATGLEFTFEDLLSGERGATLYLKDPDGQIISRLAERVAVPGQSITTTIEPGLQYRLQQSLGNFRGAIVVMEVDTGRILAMVSNPQFDPNLFDINNQNFFYARNPYAQPNDPVFNRATNGQYPLGSVFKVVTMAVALETGIFQDSDQIYCGHSIEVCGNTLYDWTFERDIPPSGDLTLSGGLMRSCNPWFYLIGEELMLTGNPDAIIEMSRDFGLGRLTGVEVPEQPGNIPSQSANCELNVQLAIGQGEMTVTPLQVASFIAAIANGGTLYQPTLIDAVGPEEGVPSFTFAPEVQGSLPVSAENLAIIQNAMREVITNPRGTAHGPLGTMRYRPYGKTGTAENPFGRAHAWFAGYSQVNNPDRPDIAVVVMLENAGEGSEMAAPVFRRAVSLYFSNYSDIGRVLPWEAYAYVVASPTPIPSETPIPTNTPLPTETPTPGEETEAPIEDPDD